MHSHHFFCEHINRIMNVAIFASAFHPHVGGVEELTRQLAHEYARQGIGTIVLTSRWPRSLPRRELYQGIPIYRLPMRIPESSIKSKISFHLTHALNRWAVTNILRKHRIDVLHVQCVSTTAYYALLSQRSLGLPLIVSAQGERTMDASGLYQRSPFINRVLKNLLAEASYITACSRNTLDDLEQWFGSPFGKRASVVYNGVCLKDFSDAVAHPHPFPYILSIGRLVPQKGFEVLIKGFAKAGTSTHHLLIAGDGPECSALEALVVEHHLQDRVRFLGKTDRATTVALFAGCSFFVLPSRQEPMGIVNLEAMAAGKAVVASRVGGVPEIVIDGETGILVPPANPDALAAGIARLATDESLRTRLGLAGWHRAHQFRWEAIAGQYNALYRNTLGRTGNLRHVCKATLETTTSVNSKSS